MAGGVGVGVGVGGRCILKINLYNKKKGSSGQTRKEFK